VFIIADATGRLLTPNSVYQRLQPWPRPPSPPLEASQGDFGRFTAVVGPDRMAMLLGEVTRLRVAREVLAAQSSTVLAQRAEGAARALQHVLSLEARTELVERRDALEASVRALQAERDSLRAGLDRRQQRASEHKPWPVAAAEPVDGASPAPLLLRARRLVLAHQVLAVLPPLPELELGDADLGAVAHLVQLLAVCFNVPLRFAPLFFANRSLIVDPVLVKEGLRFPELQSEASKAGGFAVFPLFHSPRLEGGLRLLQVLVQQLGRGVQRALGLPQQEFDDSGRTLQDQLRALKFMLRV
jgi:hypothetical protein